LAAFRSRWTDEEDAGFESGSRPDIAGAFLSSFSGNPFQSYCVSMLANFPSFAMVAATRSAKPLPGSGIVCVHKADLFGHQRFVQVLGQFRALDRTEVKLNPHLLDACRDLRVFTEQQIVRVAVYRLRAGLEV
jgi:hypothetical protein